MKKRVGRKKNSWLNNLLIAFIITDIILLGILVFIKYYEKDILFSPDYKLVNITDMKIEGAVVNKIIVGCKTNEFSNAVQPFCNYLGRDCDGASGVTFSKFIGVDDKGYVNYEFNLNNNLSTGIYYTFGCWLNRYGGTDLPTYTEVPDSQYFGSAVFLRRVWLRLGSTIVAPSITRNRNCYIGYSCLAGEKCFRNECTDFRIFPVPKECDVNADCGISAKKCENERCVDEIGCIDSDPQNSPYIPGNVTVTIGNSQVIHFDWCNGSASFLEFSCNSATSADSYSESILCPSGTQCLNGVCYNPDSDSTPPPYDLSSHCGNGVIDEGEICDGNLFSNGKAKCPDYGLIGFGSNDLICYNECESYSFDNCRIPISESLVSSKVISTDTYYSMDISASKVNNKIHIWSYYVRDGSNYISLLSSDDGKNFYSQKKLLSFPYRYSGNNYNLVGAGNYFSSPFYNEVYENGEYKLYTSSFVMVFENRYFLFRGWRLSGLKFVRIEPVPEGDIKPASFTKSNVQFGSNTYDLFFDATNNKANIVSMAENNPFNFFSSRAVRVKTPDGDVQSVGFSANLDEPINDKFFRYEISEEDNYRNQEHNFRYTLNVYELTPP